jgi:hypothetical protein
LKIDSIELAAQIPEPASFILFFAGILGVLGYGYRRRKKAA